MFRHSYIALITILICTKIYTQTPEQKSQYLNSLLKLQQDLNKKLNELRFVTENIEKQRSNYEGYPNIQIVTLQQGIDEQRNKLLEMEMELLRVPYQAKSWECQTMKKEQSEPILSEIQESKQEIANLKKILAGTPECPRNDQLKDQTIILQQRLNYLSEQLTHICEPGSPNSCKASLRDFWNGAKCIHCPQGATFHTESLTCACPGDQEYSELEGTCFPPKETLFIPNLSSPKAKNWIYGQKYNEKSYSNFMNSEAESKNLVKCADSVPFVDTKDICMGCEEQGQVYDLSSQNCVQCSQDTKFNESSHQCETSTPVQECQYEGQYFNGDKCIKCSSPNTFDASKLECFCAEKGFLYDKDSEECRQTHYKNTNPAAPNYDCKGKLKFDDRLQNCPSEKPFFDSHKVQCVACASPKYWHCATQQCSICENAYVFEIASGECKPELYPKKNSYSNIGTEISNYAGTIPAGKSGLDSCIKEKPFFDGYNCVPCSRPSYFNFTSSKCEACRQDQTFNEVSKTCEKQPKVCYKSNTQKVSNFFGKIVSEECEEGSSETKTCPDANPFYNGKQCLSCSAPKYFDFNSNQCVACPGGKEFTSDPKKGPCKECQSCGNVFNSYLVDVKNFECSPPSFNPAVQSCPKQAPFFDSKKCVSCAGNKYFSFCTNSCQQCADQKYFNINSQQCEFHQDRCMTDIKNQNIYYNGNFADVIVRLEKVKEADPDIYVCEGNTPFCNAGTGECMACPAQGSDKDLFDIKYSRCIKCRNGSYFSQDRHVCVSEGVVPPTVERMVMNTFSWF